MVGRVTARPLCPCGTPAFRLQRSKGIFAVYPCNCWLTPVQAGALVEAWREIRDARATA